MLNAIPELGINPGLNFYCPKCGSRDVVIKIEERYYKIYKCNSCDFVTKEIYGHN